MDRSFVIAQISDLHLDGSGRLLPTIEALSAALRERMADLADVPDRILLITGDLVDDPTPRALDEALAVIASLRQTGVFTDIQAVAGNHDVKRPSQWAGRHDVYDYLHLPRTSKSVYYRQGGLDLVLLDSNRASLTTLASGHIDEGTYNAMVADSARLSVELAGSIGSAGRADYAEPTENLVRVLALHHHPLPQATGEGKRFLGAPDEPLMYLAAPGTFLEAATSLNVNLVLHGHRHVEGLTRYSIPDPRAISSESGEAFWRTIYVLSCPSSTGQAGDDAGFNIVHFGPSYRAGRTDYRFAITRYSRPRNGGAFGLLDSNLPDGIIRLPAGRDFSRDPAVQSAIEIASCASLKRDQVAVIARRLFMRRGFYDEAEPDWASAFYTYVVSSHAWTDLEGKVARSGPRSDIDALSAVRTRLNRLIAQSADVLGVDRAQLDELSGRRSINRDDFLRQLPRLSREGVDARQPARQRRQLLRDLNEQVKALGLNLDLGGEAPPQTSP
ncbi:MULTISPECIES: metallophosphoesterase [unclassified Bradyrhizobium]|uniref:metallophosphoesterase family protein n=1 Tax=unclassified Bradyrhizobium TaxID=2631580 RepID=UPI001FF2F35B|nr:MULTISPECIES: metallophosphoesterase [unclassified Bradyrhizobium]MCJ9702559.1 metallophosphoesterase [Bradyrhizobium sp. SHOUNA76]MCJ9730498.1 metallophosphoesterase [Bradyrhizobium sp. PRIMUS42]